MYVTSLRVEGLRDAPAWEERELGRVVSLPPGPAGVAVVEALEVLAASLVPDGLPSALGRLGLAPPGAAPEVLEEGGLPVQADIPAPGEAAAWLDLAQTRNVAVQVELALDPPLYGRLREIAVRDPRLVTALGQAPTVRVKVGWLFTRDLSAVALGLSEVGVGDVSLSSVPAERPRWLAELLGDLGRRFLRVDDREPETALVERLAAASLSPEPDRRRRYRAASEALGRPPFGLGDLEIVRSDGRLQAAFGPELRRARRFGGAGLEALRLVEAVLLAQPDVLAVEGGGAQQRDPTAVRDWLAAATEGPEATLEQVFLAPGGGR